MLASLGSKGKNRNSLACLRNASSHSAESYCTCNYTKLGFRDEATLAKAHKAVDLMHLRKINITACEFLHDAIFDHPTKETVARTKIHNILKTNEFVEILKGAVDDDDDQ